MRVHASGEAYTADLSFRDAAKLVCRAWRKRHSRLAPPPLSHALSVYEDGVWVIKDSEVGEVVAMVRDGAAALDED